MTGSLVSAHPDVSPLLSESESVQRARALENVQRARVLEAMIQLVAEKGFAGATVTEAVRRARVSRATFYELFDSKQACLLAAYELGSQVLDERVVEAARDAPDWLTELRLGMRAYLHALRTEPIFARIHLLEWQLLGADRDASTRRFVRRYAGTFARSGRPVPSDDALFALSAGIDQLVCARLRAGEDIGDLEDTMVAFAARMVGEEVPWE